MTESLTIEIDKKNFFNNWDIEERQNLTDEDKDAIIKFFINRNLCLKRDNYKCQNKNCEEDFNAIEQINDRREFMSVHHIIARRDFKENPTLQKRLGYECNDLINLITICKPCHKGYERARLTILVNEQEYKLERPIKVDMKAIIKEGRLMRRELKKLGQVGWAGLSEDDRVKLICILMKWLTEEVVFEMRD